MSCSVLLESVVVVFVFVMCGVVCRTMRPKFNLSQLSVESSDSISSLTEGQDFVSGSVSPSPSL